MKNNRSLEERITEAIDGMLDERQFADLVSDLKPYPELLAELRMQTKGSPLGASYADVQPDPFAVSRLRQKLRTAEKDQWQFDALHIFKRYVLASSLGIILFLAVLHAIPGTATSSDLIDDEITTMFESLEVDALTWSMPETPVTSQR